MVSKKTSPELKVVFNTSVLFTKAESELLSTDAKSLIAKHSSHADLRVTWYLPDMVRNERIFQMR
jgi:hypothetical protein